MPKKFGEIGAVIALCVLLFAALNATLFSVNGYRYPSIGYRIDNSAITVPDNTGLCPNCGDGVSQYTISSPNKANYVLISQDSGGMRLYLGEAGDVKAGDIITFTGGTGTNTITVGEKSGVVNLGSSTRALGADDHLQLMYSNGNWTELAFVNN